MNWNTKANEALVGAIMSLKNAGEARRFLRDLLTENEIEEFGKRFETARLLSENVPYSVIEEVTGLSSTTVARVSKWLNGKEGGYRILLERLRHRSKVPVRRGLS